MPYLCEICGKFCTTLITTSYPFFLSSDLSPSSWGFHEGLIRHKPSANNLANTHDQRISSRQSLLLVMAKNAPFNSRTRPRPQLPHQGQIPRLEQVETPLFAPVSPADCSSTNSDDQSQDANHEDRGSSKCFGRLCNSHLPRKRHERVSKQEVGHQQRGGKLPGFLPNHGASDTQHPRHNPPLRYNDVTSRSSCYLRVIIR